MAQQNPFRVVVDEAQRRAESEARRTPADMGRGMPAVTGGATAAAVDPHTDELVLVSLLDRDAFGETLGTPQDGWALG